VSKKALIITDETQSISSIAKSIKDALAGFNVKICHADKFEGTDILPVDIFFIGCDTPSVSFAYLEEMLSHINLASRKCGIFSTKQKTLKYFSDILKDSEADLGETMLSTDGGYQQSDINKWIKGLLK
jgi:molybdopterin-guanine dinucleotide biosynthesis protein A